jgi:hypothetical protein
MSNSLVIKNYCRIDNNEVIINGKIVYKDEKNPVYLDFIKGAYREFKINYPKFFKMDSLSKLGFLTADIMIRDDDFVKKIKGEDIGIIILNSSSSLDTDKTYNESIKDRNNYFPSPSIFVYTLPNIMIGEICIKHKISGENGFYVSEKFNSDFLHRQVKELFDNDRVKCCIAGWVEMLEDKYASVLYCIKKKTDSNDDKEIINFDAENLLEIINTKY